MTVRKLSSRPPTVRDVAREAGVCYATASRVLTGNNKYNILPETRNRVLQAARKLSYTANPFARSLKTQRSNIIGLCIAATYGSTGPDGPWRTQLTARLDVRLDGLYRHPRAGRFDVMVIPRNDEDPNLIEHLVPRLRFLDGIIFVTPRVGQEEMLRTLAEQCPLVAEDAMGLDTIPSVTVDQEDAIRKACNCLVKHGCRSLGMLGGSDIRFSHLRRRAAFLQTLAELKLDSNPMRIKPDGADRYDVYRTASELFRSFPDIDGLIVGRDNQLVWVLGALEDLGRKVGEDIRIVSINETNTCLVSRPSITAVRFPTEAMTLGCFDMLLRLIENPKSPPEQVVLPVQLVERESTLGIDPS